MAKVKLDRAYLIPYPNGLREVKGPGEVDANELPEEFVKRLQARQKGQQQQGGTPLSGDFPGYRALSKAGYNSVEEVQKLDRDKLTEIDGIGDTTAETIMQAARGKASAAHTREVNRAGGYDPETEKVRSEQGGGQKPSGEKGGNSKDEQ